MRNKLIPIFPSCSYQQWFIYCLADTRVRHWKLFDPHLLCMSFTITLTPYKCALWLALYIFFVLSWDKYVSLSISGRLNKIRYTPYWISNFMYMTQGMKNKFAVIRCIEYYLLWVWNDATLCSEFLFRGREFVQYLTWLLFTIE